MSLEDLIKEGETIHKRRNGTYDELVSRDICKWEHLCLRFLLKNFEKDVYTQQFKSAIGDRTIIEETKFHKEISLLYSIKEMPETIEVKDEGPKQETNIINISQNQSQEQKQNLSIEMLDGILKDELKGNKYEDIKEILDNKEDKESTAKKLRKKFIEFGSDTLANIVTKIISNRYFN